MYVPDFFVLYEDAKGNTKAEVVEIKPTKETNLKEAGKSAYNQAMASETPWGLQDIGRPLSSQDIIDLLNKTYKLPTPAKSATRVEQYNPASYVTPVGLGPVVPTVQNTTTTGTTTTGSVAPRLTDQQIGLVVVVDVLLPVVVAS